MNSLAEKMSEWESKKRELNIIEEEIKREILALGKTQKVGNVTGSFSKGRGSYDYQKIAERANVSKGLVEMYTEPVTDWKKVCDEAQVNDDLKSLFYKEGNPSVSLKLE